MFRSRRYHRAMTERDHILFDLCMALRSLPPGTLRDLVKRRFPGEDLAEKIVAERIVEHLELCGWQLTHKAKPAVTPAR